MRVSGLSRLGTAGLHSNRCRRAEQPWELSPGQCCCSTERRVHMYIGVSLGGIIILLLILWALGVL